MEKPKATRVVRRKRHSPVGNEFEKVETTFTGLSPNTEYHYQLIANNSNGEVKTEDQTFTTEHSPAEERQAENCPNTEPARRKQLYHASRLPRIREGHATRQRKAGRHFRRIPSRPTANASFTPRRAFSPAPTRIRWQLSTSPSERLAAGSPVPSSAVLRRAPPNPPFRTSSLPN